MSNLTFQLTKTALKEDLEEFIYDKYDFINKINQTFNLSVDSYPSLKIFFKKPIINLLALDQDPKALEKDIYNILMQACLNNHSQAIKILSLIYNTATGRKIAIKVYQDFFETKHFIDFILNDKNISEEFNLKINLTPKKTLALIRLLIASVNK